MRWGYSYSWILLISANAAIASAVESILATALPDIWFDCRPDLHLGMVKSADGEEPLIAHLRVSEFRLARVMTDHYVIKLDSSVDTPERLFAIFTDTIYLGQSGIDGWDKFYDVLINGLDGRDALVTVEIMNDFTLWPEVSNDLHWIADALIEDCPDKVTFIWPVQ